LIRTPASYAKKAPGRESEKKKKKKAHFTGGSVFSALFLPLSLEPERQKAKKGREKKKKGGKGGGGRKKNRRRIKTNSISTLQL